MNNFQIQYDLDNKKQEIIDWIKNWQVSCYPQSGNSPYKSFPTGFVVQSIINN